MFRFIKKLLSYMLFWRRQPKTLPPPPIVLSDTVFSLAKSAAEAANQGANLRRVNQAKADKIIDEIVSNACEETLKNLPSHVEACISRNYPGVILFRTGDCKEYPLYITYFTNKEGSNLSEFLDFKVNDEIANRLESKLKSLNIEVYLENSYTDSCYKVSIKKKNIEKLIKLLPTDKLKEPMSPYRD